MAVPVFSQPFDANVVNQTTPPSVSHVHLTIYPAVPGPGVEMFAADFGPVSP